VASAGSSSPRSAFLREAVAEASNRRAFDPRRRRQLERHPDDQSSAPRNARTGPAGVHRCSLARRLDDSCGGPGVTSRTRSVPAWPRKRAPRAARSPASPFPDSGATTWARPPRAGTGGPLRRPLSRAAPSARSNRTRDEARVAVDEGAPVGEAVEHGESVVLGQGQDEDAGPFPASQRAAGEDRRTARGAGAGFADSAIIRRARRAPRARRPPRESEAPPAPTARAWAEGEAGEARTPRTSTTCSCRKR